METDLEHLSPGLLVRGSEGPTPKPCLHKHSVFTSDFEGNFFKDGLPSEGSLEDGFIVINT